MKTVKAVLSHPVHFLAFGGGAGLSPVAPGTFGTMVALPLYWWLAGGPLWLYLCVLVAVTLAGFWICGRSAELLGVHDHPGIVWDEIAGMLLTMLPWSLGWMQGQLLPWLIFGFVAFRFFDVLKPWPIKIIDQNVQGGFGIMVDDLLAGLYAAGVLLLAQQIAKAI